MKKNILLFLAVMLFSSCEEHQPITQYLSVIIDLTDADSYKPTSKEVFGYLKQGHSSDGLEVALRYVSETRYAPNYEFQISTGAVGFLSNEDTRRRKKKRLLTQFKDTLTNYKKRLCLRSEIFRLVVNELGKLSKVKGKRSLLLFADLKENSFYSVYKKQDIQELLLHPKRTQERFENAISIPDDLTGVEIHIVYAPSLKEDRVFTAMIDLYRNVFESRGAVLNISRSQIVKF
jgi:hypothetical protein